MLSFNPDQRVTADECLMHPMFDGLRNEEREEPFAGNIKLDDLSFLDSINCMKSMERLKGILHHEINWI